MRDFSFGLSSINIYKFIKLKRHISFTCRDDVHRHFCLHFRFRSTPQSEFRTRLEGNEEERRRGKICSEKFIMRDGGGKSTDDKVSIELNNFEQVVEELTKLAKNSEKTSSSFDSIFPFFFASFPIATSFPVSQKIYII